MEGKEVTREYEPGEFCTAINCPSIVLYKLVKSGELSAIPGIDDGVFSCCSLCKARIMYEWLTLNGFKIYKT